MTPSLIKMHGKDDSIQIATEFEIPGVANDATRFVETERVC